MRKFHAGMVVWTDAVSFGGVGGQFDAHDTPHYPLMMFTTGLILKSDESGVSMAKEISADADLRGCCFIPRGMIKKEIIYRKNAVIVDQGKMKVNQDK